MKNDSIILFSVVGAYVYYFFEEEGIRGGFVFFFFSFLSCGLLLEVRFDCRFYYFDFKIRGRCGVDWGGYI